MGNMPNKFTNNSKGWDKVLLTDCLTGTSGGNR